jgi:hypothetical protein
MVTAPPASVRRLAGLRAELDRLIRYDDESIVHDTWIRERYDCGCYTSYAPARRAVVETAWHEAGHAVAALAVGATFSSASIHHSCRTEGRVHGIRADGELSFVIDAGGQLGQRLRDWSLPGTDAELRAWLRSWARDGGDARRFRRAIRPRFGTDEVAAWRYCEQILVPRRLAVRQVARALLISGRFLPSRLITAVAAGPAG